MPRCIVLECVTRNEKGGKDSNVIFHRLPHEKTHRNAWLVACRQVKPVDKSSGVCSKHFVSSQYQRDLRFELLNPDKDPATNPRRKLLKTAVPMKNIPGRKPTGSRLVGQHSTVRDRQNEIDQAMGDMDSSPVHDSVPDPSEETCDSSMTMASELKAWKTKAANLLSALLKKEKELTAMKDRLGEIFTPQQVNFFASGIRPCPWDEETTLKSLNFRCNLSKKQYEWLRQMQFPLPSISTLQNWLREFNVNPGSPDCALKMLSQHLRTLPEAERYCTVMFDEMAVSSIMTSDSQSDTILGPFSQLQVVM